MLVFASSACDSGAPGSFPPEDPALAAQNQAAGDPYAGRFPFADAIAGLPESGKLRATIVSDGGEIHCELLADVARWQPRWTTLAPLADDEVGELVDRMAPEHDASVTAMVRVDAAGAAARPWAAVSVTTMTARAPEPVPMACSE